jgi:hypothetical protein
MGKQKRDELEKGWATRPLRTRVVVTKYPMTVRVEVSLVCLVAAWCGIAALRSTGGFLFVAVAICILIHILSYCAEVDESEIRVRYWPLVNRVIPMSDVQSFAEERTLVLITPTSRIPLWGLSDENRGQLFRILPERIEVENRPRSHPEKTPLKSLRTHFRVTKLAGAAFVTTSITLIPFLDSHSWNKYWEPWGKRVLLLDMALFLVLLFEIGTSLVYWFYLRDR